MELVPVILVDKPVLEHSEALVGPQLDHIIFLGDGFGIRLCNSLEHFGHISGGLTRKDVSAMENKTEEA